LKVALVVHSNILKKVDGMTAYYKRLCQYAPGVNHQLDIFMQDPDQGQTLQINSTRFFLIRVKTSFQALPEAYLSFNPWYYIQLAWYFHGVFKKEKYDCLQVASAHPMSLSAIAAAKRLGMPVIGSYHTLLPEYARYWSNRKFESLFAGKLVARGLTAFVRNWTRLVYGAADIILPSILTTIVGTSIHLFSDTPNIFMTAGTILGLALFNFCMLSEIHRRHETISPWELTRIFTRYLINTLGRIRPSFKKKAGGFAP